MTTFDRFHVLTGGPGSGKTTLADHLHAAGFGVTEEAGRAVIRAETRAGESALPWGDRAAFARRMASHEMRSYRNARASHGPVFFDRGLPDTVGYLRLCGLGVPPALAAACRRVRYARRVFILPPWREIYATDAERRQDFDEAIRTWAMMRIVWRDLGYDLVDVPIAPVAERAAFVLRAAGIAETG
jgi:predicted ATPase